MGVSQAVDNHNIDYQHMLQRKDVVPASKSHENYLNVLKTYHEYATQQSYHMYAIGEALKSAMMDAHVRSDASGMKWSSLASACGEVI